MHITNNLRDEHTAKLLSKRIRECATKKWTIMEVCGGQTHTILQYGLEELLPTEIQLVHGPGCPICVTPVETIDKAIAIASEPDVIFCSFGDMLRVPGTGKDLLDVKAHGGDVRLVYSPLDAVAIAKENPHKRVVFFAVGFETTAPANAMSVWQAKRLGLQNFFALCSHVTVPPVIGAVLNEPDNKVQAFLGPGHVCSIMGEQEYQQVVEQYKVPVVITGFEPIDLLDGILRCVQQLEAGCAKVENAYRRVVKSEGNKNAQALLAEVFELCDQNWRGLGRIPMSGYRLAPNYAQFDAHIVFPFQNSFSNESELCISGQILRGVRKPFECPAFGTTCTPENPIGATMVSSEGTCANYYKFSRYKYSQQQ